MHVDDALERRVGLRHRRPRGAGRRADRAAPQRRDRAGGALGHAREAVAVARGLAGEQQRAAGREHALELAERAAAGRGCGAAPRGRARGRSSRRRTAARSASAGSVCTSSPSRSALARERREHARRDVAAGRLADQPGAQQVQREVAGPGADLQRAREAGRAARAERLAHLREHLLAADLAEVDAPLGVVVIGRHVVVARVDVADLLGAQGWRHGAAPYTRAPCRLPAAPRLDRRDRGHLVEHQSTIVQRDQPDGVPPLALTGERTLPDVPEENYWFRRHLVVYEWIAARVARPARDRHGLRRGLRLGRARRAAPRASSASTPTPRRTSTRGCATAARTCASSATLVETFSEPADAVVFLQTIEHLQDPGATLEHFRSLVGDAGAGAVYVSTPNVLTLAPKGAERSDNPWHVHEYRARGVRAAVPRALRARWSCSASSTRASCARTSSRCGSAGTRVHAAPGPDRALLRLVHAGDRGVATSRCAPAAEARPGRGRSTSSRCAGRERAARERGALAIVLHTHMPYVEGFGTWPFGEEWLWEAIAGCYLPLLDLLDAGAPLTLSLTPVLCDQLEAPGVAERFARFVERGAPPHARRGRRGAARRRARAARARARALVGRLRAARCERCARRGGDLLGALAPYAQWTSAATHAVLPLLATDAGVRAAGAERRRLASRALRRAAGGAASGCRSARYAPWLEPALADAGVRARLRRADRPLRARRAASTCGRCVGDVGRRARADRPRDDGARVERRAAIRRTAPTATTTTTRPPPQPVGQRRRAPTTTRARSRSRASTPPTSSRARSRAPGASAGARPAGRRARRVRARHRAARPLVVRGHRLARRGRRGVRAPGPRAGAPRRCAGALSSRRRQRRRERRRAEGRPSSWGERTATSRRGRGRPSRSWRSRRARPSCEVLRGGPRAERGSGARAAGAAVERLGVHGRARDRRAVRARALRGPPPSAGARAGGDRIAATSARCATCAVAIAP